MKSKPGSGQRFKNLANALANDPNVKNPKAVAASIGRKKYGSTKFAQFAAHGRKRRRHR